MDISIIKVRFGYWEYSTIYKNLKTKKYSFVYKLYETNNVRTNKKNFKEYVQLYTQY